MRKVNGYRGYFWGCPIYPNCTKTSGSALGPTDEERSATRAELLQVYNSMNEESRKHWREKLEAQFKKDGLLELVGRTSEEWQLLIAAKYLKRF